MRIVAGSARGRALKGPKGTGLRPTADRVRESIFNILGQWLEGLSVLDLYAGTGALAFEALSRGAARAVLVDSGKEAVALCRENARALGMEPRVSILAGPVSERTLRPLAERPFDLVFADPPYAAAAPAELLELVWRLGLLAPGGRLVIEHDRRVEAPASSGGLTRVDGRRFGDTAVTFFRAGDLLRGSEAPLTPQERGGKSSAPMAKHIVIYPGSFDPPTNGHISLIHRALRIFDQVIVAVAHNPKKSPLFSVEERKRLIVEAVEGDPRVEVDSFEGLLVDYARRRNVLAVMRGLRAVSDFEYEFQMANMNRKLAKDIETVFIMTGEDYFYISSRLVREVASFGGDVSDLVPACVLDKLNERFRGG